MKFIHNEGFGSDGLRDKTKYSDLYHKSHVFLLKDGRCFYGRLFDLYAPDGEMCTMWREDCGEGQTELENIKGVWL